MAENDVSRRNFLEGVFKGALYSAATVATRRGLNRFGPVDPGLGEPPSEDPHPTGYLKWLTQTVPEIGGTGNYDKPLAAGIGFATLHNAMVPTAAYHGDILRQRMAGNNIDYDDLLPNEKNIFDLTSYGLTGIRRHIVGNQADLSPHQILASNQYIGFVATRSRFDIGKKYLVYASFPPREGENPFCIGGAMAVDSPQKTHWSHNTAHWRYSYLGWSDLPWIADASPSLMEKLPVGISGNPKKIREGRPGMILISEEYYLNNFSPN